LSRSLTANWSSCSRTAEVPEGAFGP
jgi:hypothetical protein